MYNGNCAMKFDTDEVSDKMGTMSVASVNKWLDKNVERMQQLSIMEPACWLEQDNMCLSE